MGMLVYPWTISNYFVILLIPMLYLWARFPRSVWLLIVIAVTYPVCHVANGEYSIVSTILLWGTAVAIGMRQIQVARQA